MQRLEEWTKAHLKRQEAPRATAPTATRTEAGLRVCPGCGKPLHLGATECRDCGIPVPRALTGAAEGRDPIGPGRDPEQGKGPVPAPARAPGDRLDPAEPPQGRHVAVPADDRERRRPGRRGPLGQVLDRRPPAGRAVRGRTGGPPGRAAPGRTGSGTGARSQSS